jgi:hypothetical protein
MRRGSFKTLHQRENALDWLLRRIDQLSKGLTEKSRSVAEKSCRAPVST